jgi:CHAT domain-containing protein
MNIKKYKIIASATALCLITVFAAYGQTSQTSDTRELLPNQTVERELAGGQTHVYRVKLKANEFLQVKVEEKGVDIAVKLFDKNGKQLAKMHTWNGTEGFEILTFIVTDAGVYTVEVGSLEATAAKGNYTIFLETPRAATEKDRKTLQAKTAFSEAMALAKERTAESYRAAREKFLAASRLYREISDKRGEAESVGSAGLLSDYLGEKRTALKYYSQALRLDQAVSGKSQAVSNISKEAAALFDKSKEAAALFDIGELYYTLGEKQKALEYFNQSARLDRAVGGKSEEAHSLRNIGNIYSNSGENQKALAFYNKSLRLRRAINDKPSEAQMLNVIGSLYYYHFGDKQKALEYYNKSLWLARAISFKEEEAGILSNLMILYNSPDTARLAIVFGKQAVNIHQQTRSDFKGLSKSFQQSYLEIVEGTYRRLAEILIEQGRLPEAQAVLDLLKEEEFKQIARRSGEPLFTLPYNRTEEEAIKIVDRLASLGRELSDLKAKSKDSLTAGETKRLSDIESVEIPAANKALRQAIEALSTVAPDAKNALDLKMKDNIQNILPALGKGVVALYTVIGKTTDDEDSGVKANNNAQAKSVNSTALNKTDNKTDNNKTSNRKINVGWILLVTPEFRKAYPIDTRDLEQTVFKFREALSSPLYDPQPVAQELYKKLFLQTSAKQKTTLAADLETYLGKQKDKTLMWNLDGVLRYVPMAALHDGKGYLVEKYRNVVFNTASLGSLKDLPKPNWEVVGLGVSTKATVKAYDGRTVNFWALKDSESELNAIIKEKNRTADVDGLFPGTLKINNDFTKEALFEGARTGMPVMHISTHFWFNPAQEDTSFLLLGNGGRLQITEFQDYPQLFSNVDFLSLSACDTATGGNANNTSVTGKADTEQKARESNGKEIEGLAYVAQTLGAKSVMASLWQVSDTGTKELMLKFYQIRKEQPELPKGEALRQAQLSLLHRTNKVQAVEGGAKGIDLEVEEKNAVEGLKPFKKDGKIPLSHPYYWSSFILIGNWR